MQIFNQAKFFELLAQNSSVLTETACKWNEGRPGEKIELIKKFNHHDEFYTLYSIKENKVIWHWGFDRHMGYPITTEHELSIEFYIGLIHPFLREWMTAFLAGIQKVVMDKKLSKIDFFETRYCVNLPMRNAKGKYMFIKQFSMPFTFDKAGMMETYLNCHVIVDKYKGEPLKPRIFHMEKRNKADEMLVKQAAAHFLNIPKKNLLTPQLLNAIKTFKEVSQNKKGILTKITKGKIARKNKSGEHLKSETINRYRHRIKTILLPLLQIPNYNTKDTSELELLKWIPDFEETYTLIDFMLESGIVDVLEYYKANKLYQHQA
ncbi:hypothetical protein [Limnovirga soli]|uniref:Uncharacterized protein n=1 Tax=Limnovirga soli TaxID=2656915 RepID=A0A8J8FER8_9BACT|nr:hypothetical protein [Limnovirga soli]NNV55034.1 hypothetical protein [Limnovirga soli]